MKTISPIILALMVLFSAVLSTVIAKAVPEAETKPDADPKADDFSSRTYTRLANPLGTIRHPLVNLRRGYGGLRSPVSAVLADFSPLGNPFAIRSLAGYDPNLFSGFNSAATAALIAQASNLKGINAARSALLNQVFANQLFDNFY